MVSYDILAIACLNLLCVSECMYVYLCMYVCMYDVCHNIQIPCTCYVAINRLYLIFILYILPHTIVIEATTSNRELL